MLKTAAFIDGSNLYATGLALNMRVDFKSLKTWLSKEYNLIRPYYYTALRDTGQEDPIIKLVDWLDYNGYCLRTKDTKEFMQVDGKVKVKGNMDVEISVDMLMVAQHVEHIILFSGDGDFTYVVEKVQEIGAKVTVVSTIKTQPRMIADDLRRQCDDFIDLDQLKGIVGQSFDVQVNKFGT